MSTHSGTRRSLESHTSDLSNRINISKDDAKGTKEVDLRDPMRRTSGVWEFKTTLSN